MSDYCVEVLRALGVKWGPTHTEIMATAQGPRSALTSHLIINPYRDFPYLIVPYLALSRITLPYVTLPSSAFLYLT